MTTAAERDLNFEYFRTKISQKAKGEIRIVVKKQTTNAPLKVV